MQIKIPYKPREWAKKIHKSDKRWKLIVAHRRAGKTVACLNHLLREALTNKDKDSRYAYIAPTYKQAKQVAWDMLKSFASVVPHTKFNEAELRCDLPNGSRITLLGSDNPDSIRGIALWGCIFDEYSQQPSNIFTEIVRPALSDHQGWAIWIGTPKGKNSFYELYKRSMNDKRWMTMMLKASKSKILPKGELKDAKIEMTEDEFNQEYECSFESALKGAYYADEIAKAYKENRIASVPHEAALPVDTVWDLGVSDSTAIGFFQKVGKERRMIDYYENTGYGLDHYIREINSKPYIYNTHYAPHDIEVRELTTGRTRLETAQDLGIHFEVLEKLSLMDGINAGRVIFNQVWFDEENCRDFINAISQYTKVWDDKSGAFKDKPKHDWTSHAADMFRYYAISTPVETSAEEDFEQMHDTEY